MSFKKRRASNKRRPLISAAPLGIHIEISTFPLIRAAPLTTALIRIVTVFFYKLNQNETHVDQVRKQQNNENTADI